jgi:hypothetical protein
MQWPVGFPVSHVFLVSRNTKLNEIHHQFREILHVSRNKIFRKISFCFVNSKISFRFAKFHLDSLRFATFHLVSYRFAKFHLVSFPFADIQTVLFHTVNILMRFLTVLRIRIRKNPKLFNTVDPNPKKIGKNVSICCKHKYCRAGAASFGRSRSRNAMRLRRHRVLKWY